ncbi:MAG: family 78 glycoside hydrolase catalytic domain [Prolixibacteraceae bacterium]|jgi:alpha-L-rhamnosidase|nr:family 78 glycoside hydrolase catalytic domain [Prolixibacteraceae bacterium]
MFYKIFMAISCRVGRIMAIVFILTTLESCIRNSVTDRFYDLQVQDMTSPIGIDGSNVKFSWKYDGRSVLKQTFSELQVAKDKEFSEIVYKSDWIENEKYFYRLYPEMLETNRRYFWRVRIKDDKDNISKWSKIGLFTTGIQKESEWIAKLIGGNNVSMVRKEFSIDKQIEYVMANISSTGLYEFHLNGQKVGDRVLEPVQTNTTKRLVYATYDITDVVKDGKNAIGIYLGGGAYAHLYKSDNRYVLMQLNIFYKDGTEKRIITDSSWMITTGGPITYTGLYEGEKYDARLELAGWDEPEFNDSKWKFALEKDIDLNNITLYSQLQPINEKETVNSVSYRKFGNDTIVYDLGKNIVGYPKIYVDGKPGNKIAIRTAEILNNDGTINYRTAGREWKLEYTLKGNDQEIWNPKFSNSGFRYIEVVKAGKVVIEKIEGVHVHSDVTPVGSFDCSNPLINKIQLAYLLSQTGNLMGFPTDCPHRERLGWLGDALQIGISASYNFDMQYFWKKWFRDMDDDIQLNGSIHQLIPFPNTWDDEQDPVWQSASIIMPWELYWFYGDKSFLEDNYFRMERMMDFYSSISADFIIEKNRWGDWVKPFQEEKTDGAFLSTSYYFKCANIMSQIAEILEKFDDHKKYEKLATSIKKALNSKWYNQGYYAENTQTANAIALDFGIVDTKNEETVLNRLLEDIQKRDYHISAGVVGQMPVINTLLKYDRHEIIYKMVGQTTFPSFGFMFTKGATTLWERYHYGDGHSHNHVFLGGPYAKWFYQGLTGISALEPGFKKIQIEPKVLMDEVSTSFSSPYGMIVCGWKQEGRTLELNVTIPCNTTAVLYFPVTIFNPNLMKILMGEKIIWRNKKDYSGQKLRFINNSNGKVGYELMPGKYIFKLFEE